MTLRLVTPAPVVEILDIYAAESPMKPINAAAARLQAARSESFALYPAMTWSPPCSTRFPLSARVSACQTGICLPTGLTRHILFLIRHAHLTRRGLSKVARFAFGLTSSLATSRPSPRGAVRHDDGEAVGAFDRYEFESHPDVQLC